MAHQVAESIVEIAEKNAIEDRKNAEQNAKKLLIERCMENAYHVSVAYKDGSTYGFYFFICHGDIYLEAVSENDIPIAVTRLDMLTMDWRAYIESRMHCIREQGQPSTGQEDADISLFFVKYDDKEGIKKILIYTRSVHPHANLSSYVRHMVDFAKNTVVA